MTEHDQRVLGLLKTGRVAEALELARTAYQERIELDPEAHIKAQVDGYNALPGDLHLEDGILCDACKNRGNIAIAQNRSLALMECKCAAGRKAKRILRRSGLSDLVQRYRLDNFSADTPWHRMMLDDAQRYLAHGDSGAWFYTGGQVGCGKTHICAAICSELIRQGMSVRYMLWRELSTKIKANMGDDEAYSALLNPLKNVRALYIDDLLKTQRGARVQPGEINLAFELINHRYNDSSKVTIVSSEYTIDELMGIDEGIASRIAERSWGFTLEIDRDTRKNFRVRGEGMTLADETIQRLPQMPRMEEAL